MIISIIAILSGVMENNEQWKERMQYKWMENDFEWLNLYTLQLTLP